MPADGSGGYGATMKPLFWAVVLLVLAVVLGILGFVVHVGFVITKALCVVALIAAGIVWIAHLARRRSRGA